MAREDAIQVEGKVIEVFPNKTVRVELPNGHRILAFGLGRAGTMGVRVTPGDQVTVEMSPYDLSKGRITSITG